MCGYICGYMCGYMWMHVDTCVDTMCAHWWQLSVVFANHGEQPTLVDAETNSAQFGDQQSTESGSLYLTGNAVCAHLTTAHSAYLTAQCATLPISPPHLCLYLSDLQSTPFKLMPQSRVD